PDGGSSSIARGSNRLLVSSVFSAWGYPRPSPTSRPSQGSGDLHAPRGPGLRKTTSTPDNLTGVLGGRMVRAAWGNRRRNRRGAGPLGNPYPWPHPLMPPAPPRPGGSALHSR